MNAVVYKIASFMELREATPWRWSHVRHHSDTIIVGRDREIAVPRPPSLLHVCLMFFASIPAWGVGPHRPALLWPADEEDKELHPRERVPRGLLDGPGLCGHLCDDHRLVDRHRQRAAGDVHRPADVVRLLAAGVLRAAATRGLAEDVLDHRLNCRTVYYNPIFRFICWNMNYHVEHHMFPLVPYHALPRCTRQSKATCRRRIRASSPPIARSFPRCCGRSRTRRLRQAPPAAKRPAVAGDGFGLRGDAARRPGVSDGWLRACKADDQAPTT